MSEEEALAEFAETLNIPKAHSFEGLKKFIGKWLHGNSVTVETSPERVRVCYLNKGARAYVEISRENKTNFLLDKHPNNVV